MKQFEIKLLSKEFYKKYNTIDYPEMEDKSNRPFLVLLVTIEENRFAIPFRTNVKHKYCYKFSNTGRKTNSSTALDYSKSVIVNEDVYLDTCAYIDKSEYIELSSKYIFIINKFKNFLNRYKKIMQNSKKYSYEYNLFAKYCTLKYFLKELNIGV